MLFNWTKPQPFHNINHVTAKASLVLSISHRWITSLSLLLPQCMDIYSICYSITQLKINNNCCVYLCVRHNKAYLFFCSDWSSSWTPVTQTQSTWDNSTSTAHHLKSYNTILHSEVIFFTNWSLTLLFPSNISISSQLI